jgi:hypothetical protein
MTEDKNTLTNENGEFVRNGKKDDFCRLMLFFSSCGILVTVFRNSIKNDPSAEYPAEANRYHLYVALACPWVNRKEYLSVRRSILFDRHIVHLWY